MVVEVLFIIKYDFPGKGNYRVRTKKRQNRALLLIVGFLVCLVYGFVLIMRVFHSKLRSARMKIQSRN